MRPEPIDVPLTETELLRGVHVGGIRRIKAIKANDGTSGRYASFSWATDIDGANAEQAVARHLGLYWSGHANSTGADIPPDIETRSTTHDNGCLIFRQNDVKKIKNIFVLVIAKPPIYSIRGGLRGTELCQDKYWRDEEQSWWAPQDDLRDIHAAIAERGIKAVS